MYVINVDGSGERRIGAGSQPQWSSDGTEIAFTATTKGRSGIGVVSEDGSRQRSLGLGWGARWSPDGSKIAFYRQQGDNVVVLVSNRDGTGERVVFQQAACEGSGGLRWSPDGSRLALAGWSHDDIVTDVVSMNGDATPIGRGSCGAGDWSPDGRLIAVSSFSEGIYLLRADGSGETRLTTPAQLIDEAPVWSPNGSAILFIRGKYNRETDGTYDQRLWVMNADGSRQTALTHGNREEYSARWSPDGRRIVVPSGELFLVGADGAGKTQLTKTHPAEPRSTGAVVNAAAGRQQSRFEVAGRARAVALSPSIVAVLVEGFFGKRIELFEPGTGKARGGVAVDAAVADEISVSGSRIVFRVNRRVVLLDAVTKRLRTLAIAAATPIGLSIEGRRVAWAENLARQARVRALTIK